MRKSLISAIALFAILTFGTVGYMFIEDTTFDDGLYMTMITVSTVVVLGEVEQIKAMEKSMLATKK